MKWWHWLILELLIIFGVIAWIYFFPDDFEYDLGKGLFGFALIYAIEKYRETNRRKTVIENHTVEQNTGENRIEYGVVGISGSVKKTELKDQLESYEGYINDIPLAIDPCKMCKYVDANKQSHIKNTETCRLCCWCYDSKFEVGV